MSQMSQTDLIIAVATIALPFVATLAASLYQLLLAHLPASKATALRQIVGEVVGAVEQANQTAPGSEKKAVAVEMLGVLLRQRGISVSPEQLDVLIEATVGALPKSLPAVPASAMKASAATAATLPAAEAPAAAI